MAKKSNVKRSDGRIAVQVYLGRVDGKRKYKTVYGSTQKEADEAANEIKAQLKKGIDISAETDLFKTWCELYLSAKKQSVSSEYYSACENFLNFFIEFLGNKKIKNIMPHEIQMIINSLADKNPTTKKPSSKKTLKAYFQNVNSVFEYAIDNRIIDYNPCRSVKISQSAPVKKRRAISEIERKRVEIFKHRAQTAAMLMLYSGLRRGEATALLWSDIDLKNNTINVNKSYNFKSKKIKSPKTSSGVRIVNIPTILTEYLKNQKKKTIYVLTNNDGKMLTETSWKKMWQSYMIQMNIEFGGFIEKPKLNQPEKIPFLIDPFTPHCLRHTFCTLMYEAGIDVLVAKEQMGHSDIKTTLAIYTHLDSVHKIKDVSKLDAYLSPSANEIATIS